MKKKEDISNLDKKVWDEYLKNPKDIFDKEFVESKITKRHEKYRFDLHGFTLLDANKKIRELIISCQEKGFKEILLITGKGLHSNVDKNTYASRDLSKLRYAVPEYIKSQKELSNKVTEIEQANLRDGGEGALIIKSKKL